MVLTKAAKIRNDEGLLLNEFSRKLRERGIDVTPRQLRHWDASGLLKPFIDESKYRRYSYDDIDQAIFIFVLNKVLKFKLPRIRNILNCMKPEQKLQEMLNKNPVSLMSKYRNAKGEEGWYLKREMRDDIKDIQNSLKNFKESMEKFETMLEDAIIHFYKVIYEYQRKLNKEK
ncbi:MAG: MerR family transcriptional regulator [Candidatus Omnitrophica bacterium]|nr:MerR family transcriptional regulator [Candidatus Omnitrophota bacterium]MDD5351730.1 MerR family transcriptional regulator [Candidatus Omnitrophota bacterium]MDD5550940.1 MerR family transcriptional regulator [Candidatus Omnitrophota bacterium]